MADILTTIKTLQKAVISFPDPDRCLQHMASKRWSDSVTRPRCGCPNASALTTQNRWKCKNKECRQQFSVKVGALMEDSGRETLRREIKKDVKEDSTLYTDTHSSYDLLNVEYVWVVIDSANKYVGGKIYTNGIEDSWMLLKRTLQGTYISVEPFHLFRYLDEQTFRLNERSLTAGERFGVVIHHFGDSK